MSKKDNSDFPATRELDRMKAVQEKSQAIGEFLDWLLNEKKAFLAVEHEHSDDCGFISRLGRGGLCQAHEGDLFRFHYTTEKLLAEFFEIDLNKCEKERRAILEHIRKV